MAYSPSQQQVINTALQVAKRRGASSRETKALLEALSVESNFSNVQGGDRDSTGVLQQRGSQGWAHVQDPQGAITDFLTHARQANTQAGSAGQLAQRVQRSAFPARYDQQSAQASAILGSSPAPSVARSAQAGVRTQSPTPAAQPTDKRALLANILAAKDPDNFLAKTLRAQSAIDAQKAPTLSPTRVNPSNGPTASTPTSQGGQGELAQVLVRAQEVNAAKQPYKWGGGHAGKVDPHSGIAPLDCSGAVSAVLGINPKVSGELANWGAPGRGKKVTIYANPKHTFMEINGHFFGTSATNPGGGAGWIPRSAISKDYLKNFTARHPAGM